MSIYLFEIVTKKEDFLSEWAWGLTIIISVYVSGNFHSHLIDPTFSIHERLIFSAISLYRLMTVMSFPYNLILIVRMGNIYHLMLIGVSAIFTHFTGNVMVVPVVFVSTDCMGYFIVCLFTLRAYITGYFVVLCMRLMIVCAIPSFVFGLFRVWYDLLSLA